MTEPYARLGLHSEGHFRTSETIVKTQHPNFKGPHWNTTETHFHSATLVNMLEFFLRLNEPVCSNEPAFDTISDS